MNETRYRFNTYCYCFECGADWQGDLEAHDCTPRQSVAVDESSIDPLSRPYDYVKALSRAQDGRCSCGRCERSAPTFEVRELDPTEIVITRGPDGAPIKVDK